MLSHLVEAWSLSWFGQGSKGIVFSLPFWATGTVDICILGKKICSGAAVLTVGSTNHNIYMIYAYRTL